MSIIVRRGYTKYIVFFISCWVTTATAAPAEIKLGMSTALTGHVGYVGKHLSMGSAVFFDKLNRQGGINGAQVKLIIKDDGYEPTQALVNTRQLIHEDNVDALLGALGTSNSYAVLPIITKFKIPYLMPFSGAERLFTSNNPYLFNIRANYNQEAQNQVEYLINDNKLSRVGLLIQADEFGLVVESALLKALNRYHLIPQKVARYKRNSSDIDKALNALKELDLEGVFLVGSAGAAAEFINKGFEQGFKPKYTSMSFTSGPSFYSQLKYNSDVMITQVVPNPHQCKHPLCKEFLADMAQANITEPNQFHLEGYLNALVFSTAAKHCELPLQAQCLLTHLRKPSNSDKQARILFYDEIQQHKLYRTYYKK